MQPTTEKDINEDKFAKKSKNNQMFKVNGNPWDGEVSERKVEA